MELNRKGGSTYRSTTWVRFPLGRVPREQVDPIRPGESRSDRRPLPRKQRLDT